MNQIRRLLVIVPLVSPLGLHGQTPSRIATTPEALVASPLFFHGRQIAIQGTVVESGDHTRLQIPIEEGTSTAKRPVPQVYVFWRDRPSRTEGEIRGDFWDLGRVSPDDGRFASYDFQRLIEVATNGRWPARDELYVIVGATVQERASPSAPSVRSLALAPHGFAGREITVIGRFRGRNLYGDLPGPLNKSKWDFVLQSADAGVWVSGIRPRGRGFDLDPGARVDTGRWLSVNGTVRVEGGVVWIEAKSIEQTAPPDETPVEVAIPAAPPEPPPAVVFSAPIADEAGVERATTVRIQFSRDMDPNSIRDRVRVTYVPPSQGAAPEPPQYAVRYIAGTHSLEIKFASPLERFRTVKVELLEGITSATGDALQPWVLRFTTGS